MCCLNDHDNGDVGGSIYGAARGGRMMREERRGRKTRKTDQYKGIFRYMGRIKGGPGRTGGAFLAVDGAQCVGHQVNIKIPISSLFCLTCITTIHL